MALAPDALIGRRRARVMAVAVGVPLCAFVAAGAQRLALFGATAGIIAGLVQVRARTLVRIEGTLVVLATAALAAGLGMLAARAETFIVLGTLALAAAASAIPIEHRVVAFTTRYAAIAFNIGAHQPLASSYVVLAFGAGAASACVAIVLDAWRWPEDADGGGLGADWKALRGGARNTKLHVAITASTVASALLFADLAKLDKPYWVMITALVVMQPETSAGLRRIVERAGGVIVGALATAGVVTVLHATWAHVAIAIGAAYVAPIALMRRYFIGCIVVTVLVLIDFDIALESSGGVPYLWSRVIDTLIGCAFALAGTLAAWTIRSLRARATS